jgi:hypothetical protein
VRMALKIDTLQCSVGVSALRDAGCGVLRAVRVVWARRSGCLFLSCGVQRETGA